MKKKLSPIIHQIVEKKFSRIFNLDDRDKAKRTSLASFFIIYKDLSKLFNFEKILTSKLTKTITKKQPYLIIGQNM